MIDKSIEEVKKNIMLNHPKGDGLIVVEVDACKLTHTVSAVLKQQQDGEEKLISVGSKKLKKEDAKKGIPYLEFSAIHFGAVHFDDIIKGRRFKIKSDHISLAKLKLNNPVGKWADMFNEIALRNPNVEYIKGEENIIADFLTRFSNEKEEEWCSGVMNLEEDEDDLKMNEQKGVGKC